MTDYQAVGLELMKEFKYVPWRTLLDMASEWMQGEITAYQMRQQLSEIDAKCYSDAYLLNGS